MRRMTSLALSMLAIMMLRVRCADGDTSEEGQEPQTGGMTAASTGDVDPPNGAVREGAHNDPTNPTESSSRSP